MNDSQNPADDAPSVIEAEIQAHEHSAPTEDGQFRATEDGGITCLTCGVTSPAGVQRTHEASRLEGASDPDDMLLVLAVTCPACGASGSLPLGYGPQSTLEDAEVVRRLAPRR
jgi:hypothetical protein